MNHILPDTITTGEQLNRHIRDTLDKLDADYTKADSILRGMWAPIFLYYPVWGPSIAGLEWIVWKFGMRGAPPWVPTACTDGRKVWINPSFFISLPHGQRVTLICHELLHPLLNHLVRMRGWPHDISNIATDFEVNNLLDAQIKASRGGAAMEMIPDAIADSTRNTDYRGLAAEVIANKLIDERQKQPQQGNGKGKPGKGEPQPGQGQGQGSGQESAQPKVIDDVDSGDPEVEAAKRAMLGASSVSAGEFVAPASDADAAELQQKWQEIAAQTANAARLAGNAPGGWLEAIEARLTPVVDLRALLERYMTEYLPDGESDRVHRPTLYNSDVCIPDDLVEAAGTLVFVKDTSGSVSTKEAEQVLSCVEDAAERLKCKRMIVLDVDHAVADAIELQPGERIPRTFKGRGGTAFEPAFNWCAEHADDVKALVYFTDGEGSFPAEDPGYPVIWICFNPNPERITYPFGEVVPIGHLMQH